MEGVYIAKMQASKSQRDESNPCWHNWQGAKTQTAEYINALSRLISQGSTLADALVYIASDDAEAVSEAEHLVSLGGSSLCGPLAF
jgi:type II secretory pathway component PulF